MSEDDEVRRSSSRAMDLSAGDGGSSSGCLSSFNSDHDKAEGGDEGAGDSGEDLGGVDADVSELVPGKILCIPTMHFGRSLVANKRIRLYIEKGSFPERVGRAPEAIPTPNFGEAVGFRVYFTAGLRFPCDPVLPDILDHYRAELNHLTPNSFVFFKVLLGSAYLWWHYRCRRLCASV